MLWSQIASNFSHRFTFFKLVFNYKAREKETQKNLGRTPSSTENGVLLPKRIRTLEFKTLDTKISLICF